ncbi:MAG: terminase large subunit domain-containing protein [Oscillospiraceae bacterium]
MKIELKLTKKQGEFVFAGADEVLFGGAAGGGKSFGQLMDAMLYALRYPRSKQLILRRTYPELDKSLIRVAQEVYPGEIYRYNAAKHVGSFVNGSVLDFGYCDSESDVYRYQSAEYDVIRFDELTHFTKQMYLYLMSRLRGANPYPKQMKSSTNPGGVGHNWVKERFIDPCSPGEVLSTGTGSRLFIPAKVSDNGFLMRADPEYVSRLRNLCDKDKRALLYGDWDIFEGQFFTEWNREIHVCKPFSLPAEWRRYFVMDYGLDMLAGYWIAVDSGGRAYVYREVYESGLIISRAAETIRAMTKEKIYCYLAPPDMWSRRQDTGKSVAELFAEHGIMLTKADNNRVAGWYNLREWLRPRENEFGQQEPMLKIFPSCSNLIRSLPALVTDKLDPNDAATEPHEVTHAPDALRYFVAGRPVPAAEAREDSYFEETMALLSFGQ